VEYLPSVGPLASVRLVGAAEARAAIAAAEKYVLFIAKGSTSTLAER
jgi:hypothetical protein